MIHLLDRTPFPPPQNLVYNILSIPKGVLIVIEKNITVDMKVQTMYKGDLLRAGKIYTVNEETAERWIVSGLAEQETSEENNLHDSTNSNALAPDIRFFV